MACHVCHKIRRVYMYLGTSYRARDRALQYLVSQKKVNDKVIMESSFTINYAISTKYCLNNAINLYRLQPLITSKVTSKGMGDKIAGSGLMLNHLKLSFIRSGLEGLRSVLTERINGKSSVTTSSRIIMALFNNLKDM